MLPNNFSDPEWHYPYDFAPSEKQKQLYTNASARVDIFLGNQPAGVTTFGYYATPTGIDARYADIVMQNNFFMLWGFQDGPKQMTTDGQRLFVNTVYRTMK